MPGLCGYAPSGAAFGAAAALPHDRAPLLISATVAEAPAESRTTPLLQVSQSSLPFSNGLTVKAVMAINLMRMFKAGPEVSLNGSPTVSATMHALPTASFLIPSFSHSFLALSHAPPAFAIATASTHPDAVAPASAPMRHLGPTRKPIVSGERIANRAGAIISWIAARVASATQRSLSGATSSSAGMCSPWEARRMASIKVTPLRFLTSRNCLRTSWMMAPAALPTDSIVRAPKRNGSIAPSSTPDSTTGSQTSNAPAGRSIWSLKAASSESDVSTAEPIAKPFPTAAVVFPSASSESVFCRTSACRPASSAKPPALSATGP
mmetsp:Transcript_99942/g.305487  ORF Transcript_99942/g.305487 Transcript_99942/m.305487 type:complete len:322 (-) Transcript_99942:1384-2349(-)